MKPVTHRLEDAGAGTARVGAAPSASSGHVLGGPARVSVGTAAPGCPGGSKTRLISAALAATFALSLTCFAANAPLVQFDTSHIGPRQIEDVTSRHIPRDWGRAWQTLAVAFAQNRPGLLSQYFTGFAQQRLVTAIAAQQKAGVRTRYIDHGHKLAAYFYSPDGGAIELHDTADLEIQVLDGNTLVHSERVTLHYIGLMTPAADHWEVRLLEAVPSF